LVWTSFEITRRCRGKSHKPTARNLCRQRKSQTVSGKSRKLSTASIELRLSKIQTPSGQFRRHRLRNSASQLKQEGQATVNSSGRKRTKPKLTFERLTEAVRDVQERLRAQAGRAININLTLRNWLIGAYIAEYELGGADRAASGENLLDELADQLTQTASPQLQPASSCMTA